MLKTFHGSPTGTSNEERAEFLATLLISAPACFMWLLTGPQMVKITSDYRLHACVRRARRESAARERGGTGFACERNAYI